MNKEEKAKLAADPEGFVTELKATHEEALKAKDATHEAALNANNEAHATELQETTNALEAEKTAHAESLKVKDATILELQDALKKSATEDNRGIVAGTFESETGKVVAFKKGFVKVRYRGEIYNSADLISKKEYAPIMENLIEIGFGGFEEVESSKK